MCSSGERKGTILISKCEVKNTALLFKPFNEGCEMAIIVVYKRINEPLFWLWSRVTREWSGLVFVFKNL